MNCNLPKGFKASVSDRAGFDSPRQYVIRSMPQIDRRNVPMGFNESPMMSYGTGKNYNFTNSARLRRNAQARNNRNATRKSESARSFARIVAKYNSEESEM